MEYLTSSKRGSRKLSDMEPLKSSMGEISSKISSRPERSGTSSRFSALAAATRACQRSFPRSQSKLSVCSARRSGTSMGSRIFPKDRRPDTVSALVMVLDVVREAAKEGSFHGPVSDFWAGRTRPGHDHRGRRPQVLPGQPGAWRHDDSATSKEGRGQRKEIAYPKKAGSS